MLAIFALFQLSVLVISVLQDDTSSDFNDLGRQLIAGFVAAVVVAVAFAFIKHRLREKNPPAPFISIASSSQTRDSSDVTRD